MRALPAIYLVLAAASFGGSFCLNKMAAEAGMPPLAYAFWQSMLSGLGLLAIAAVRGCRVPLGAARSRPISWSASWVSACRARC